MSANRYMVPADFDADTHYDPFVLAVVDGKTYLHTEVGVVVFSIPQAKALHLSLGQALQREFRKDNVAVKPDLKVIQND